MYIIQIIQKIHLLVLLLSDFHPPETSSASRTNLPVRLRGAPVAPPTRSLSPRPQYTAIKRERRKRREEKEGKEAVEAEVEEREWLTVE